MVEFKRDLNGQGQWRNGNRLLVHDLEKLFEVTHVNFIINDGEFVHIEKEVN